MRCSGCRIIREEAMPGDGMELASTSSEAAEALALQGLTFLAEDPGRMRRFLQLTGLEPAEVRARAGTTELLAAVLEHLSADESLLLVFAAGHGIAPQSIARALAVLEGTRA
jgi:hypothetical protein